MAAGGVLLLQYHSLETIIRCGQWNALRHGHYAYYSTTALVTMLAAQGLSARRAWNFDLYGGTVLLAASREADASVGTDDGVQSLLAEDSRAGVLDPASFDRLQHHVRAGAQRLHDWLVSERLAGRKVLGYGAASRVVALLRQAEVDKTLLHSVVDASPAKHGLRMPGTDIPVVDPSELASQRPDVVLLLLTDLLNEVRASFPDVESSGASWVDVETLDSRSAEYDSY